MRNDALGACYLAEKDSLSYFLSFVFPTQYTAKMSLLPKSTATKLSKGKIKALAHTPQGVVAIGVLGVEGCLMPWHDVSNGVVCGVVGVHWFD